MSDIHALENHESQHQFYCEICKYGCNHNSVFMRHQKSEKHLRNGEKKIYKCPDCDYKTETSHWNLKMHIMSKHSTPEEKSKQKYYCATCDGVFFSPLFYKNHIKSITYINKMVMSTGSINNDIVHNPDVTLNEDLITLKAELKRNYQNYLIYNVT